MMLFLIMLFTDLFMVGICFSVYGKATLYHDHMLLGVHIPEDKLGNAIRHCPDCIL